MLNRIVGTHRWTGCMPFENANICILNTTLCTYIHVCRCSYTYIRKPNDIDSSKSCWQMPSAKEMKFYWSLSQIVIIHWFWGGFISRSIKPIWVDGLSTKKIKKKKVAFTYNIYIHWWNSVSFSIWRMLTGCYTMNELHSQTKPRILSNRWMNLKILLHIY